MLNLYFGYVNFIQGGIHTMKKRFLSIALTLAMVSSMAVGCGSSKSDSADSKKEESAKTEASADTESNQILFKGSSTFLKKPKQFMYNFPSRKSSYMRFTIFACFVIV